MIFCKTYTVWNAAIIIIIIIIWLLLRKKYQLSLTTVNRLYFDRP